VTDIFLQRPSALDLAAGMTAAAQKG